MTNMLMRDALKKYCTQVSILKKGYGQEKYRIEQLSKSFLGNKIPREVTSVDIASYRDARLAEINPRTKKTLATSTVRLEMSLLSNFFDISRIEWGICGANPVADVRKPKAPPGRDRRLTAREDRLILRYAHQHVNQDLYSIVVLALETAMRQGEILKLSWEHINLKSRIAHLPDTKNGTKRDVPLSIKARDALIRMGAHNHGRVFSYTPEGLKSTWRFMILKIGIENLHFHDLRHEAISRFFELGTLDMMEVAEQIKVKLLDFDGIEGIGLCRSSAIRDAQGVLLRKILMCLKDSTPIPVPDQYLDIVDESKVVMIDPLTSELTA